MTFMQQMISCAESEMRCADNSNYFPIPEVRLDISILFTAPEIIIVWTIPFDILYSILN